MGSKFGYVVVLLVVALFGYGIYRVWDDYQVDRARESGKRPTGTATRRADAPENTAAPEPEKKKPDAVGTKPTDDPAPVVELTTNLGTIVVQLNAKKAPKTVANFLGYVDRGHYAGTQFHRVAPGMCIQGGHFTDEGEEKGSLDAPVVNESSNGLSNLRGTVAMARGEDPDSARDQFYINLVDNDYLDYTKSSGTGYTVFGQVIEGMDVVDAIARVPIANLGGAFVSRPKRLVMIRTAKRR